MASDAKLERLAREHAAAREYEPLVTTAALVMLLMDKGIVTSEEIETAKAAAREIAVQLMLANPVQRDALWGHDDA